MKCSNCSKEIKESEARTYLGKIEKELKLCEECYCEVFY